MSVHLAIIDPATRVAETACFDKVSSLRPAWRTSYIRPALNGLHELNELDEPDAVIVLGSGASVHDALPWQTPVHRWVDETLRAGVPTLGICYGHQLIAHLFGAPVEQLWDGDKVRGTRQVEVASTRLDLSESIGPLVVSHREGVTRCPPDFRIFASSPAVEIDGIEHVHLPVWGIQPHIEAVPAFLQNNQITIDNPMPAFGFGYRIVEAFLRQIEKVSPSTHPDS